MKQIYKVYLVKTDPIKGTRKYWEISCYFSNPSYTNSTTAEFLVITAYGRVGIRPRISSNRYSYLYQINDQLRKKIREKSISGYVSPLDNSRAVIPVYSTLLTMYNTAALTGKDVLCNAVTGIPVDIGVNAPDASNLIMASASKPGLIGTMIMTDTHTPLIRPRRKIVI